MAQLSRASSGLNPQYLNTKRLSRLTVSLTAIDAPTDPADVPRKVGLVEAPGDATGVVCAEAVEPVLDAVASQVIPVKH